jgi:hypothetical protein
VQIPQGVLAWKNGTAVKLAQQAYDSEDFDISRMAVLADALEEAGCTDAWALEHLRSGAVHARGCTVVDALLGNSSTVG